MCVCTILIDVKLLLFSFSFFSPFSKAGGPSMYCERWSNEAATGHADITADHRDVPAFFMSFFCNGTWLTREPPSRFCQMRCHLMLCTFSAICFSTIFSDVLTSFFDVCILTWSTYDIFGKTFIVLAKYRHEIYFGSNCLGWLHVTGLSSWWISSNTPIVSSVIPMVTPTRCHRATGGNPFKVNVDWPDYRIDNFNLVIHLSIAKQLALPLSAFFNVSPLRYLWSPISTRVEPLGTIRNFNFSLQHQLLQGKLTWSMTGDRHVFFLQVWSLWYLVRLNISCI